MALREGGLLAKRCSAQIFLLAITPMLVAPDAHGATIVQPDDYDAILKEGLANAKKFGLPATGKLVHGDPADEISTYAAQVAADLVVVSHRRRSFLERWWSGPSQAYLLDKLSCSLLVARKAISDEEFDVELRSVPNT